MGRRAVHSTESLLDCAAGLFAAGGIRNLTFGALSRESGASNGSIHHRFPTREALLADLWMRTIGRFYSGYRDTLGVDPDATRAVEASVWIVHWCREHLSEAMILQAGVQIFAPSTWPPEQRAALDKHLDELTIYAKRIIPVIMSTTSANASEVSFVLVDLPMAVLRSDLQRGEVPPVKAEDLVRGLAVKILTPDPVGRSVADHR